MSPNQCETGKYMTLCPCNDNAIASQSMTLCMSLDMVSSSLLNLSSYEITTNFKLLVCLFLYNVCMLHTRQIIFLHLVIQIHTHLAYCSRLLGLRNA